jgi:hypothetical protein
VLLDRRRIRKWAKWVALGLAIIFALMFILVGIGNGSSSFNLLDAFSGGCTATTQPDVTQTQLDKYNAALAANPNDVDALQGAATVYEGLYQTSGGANKDNLVLAAALLERAIKADPSLIAVYLRLADLYKEQGTSAALEAEVVVLNKAIAVDPENSNIYLKLGTAQRSLGNVQAAVLAWQRFLQLDPNSQYSALIQQQLDDLTGANTTTTAGTTTTGGTGTTAGPGATTTTTVPAGTTSTPAATTSTTG